MIRNINAGAEAGSFSIVLTGDNHANAPSDLNEALGFSYIRMREQGSVPEVRTNHEGADLDVSLVDYEVNRHFLSQEMHRIGIDLVPVVLDETARPSAWLSEGNREAIDSVLDGMQQAGRLVAAGELQQAQQQLDESWGKLTERFTQDQISADSYLGSIVEIINASKSVIWDEIDKAPAEPTPDIPKNEGIGEPTPGGMLPGQKF